MDFKTLKTVNEIDTAKAAPFIPILGISKTFNTMVINIMITDK